MRNLPRVAVRIFDATGSRSVAAIAKNPNFKLKVERRRCPIGYCVLQRSISAY